MGRMKITAGLGRLEYFQRLADAGADELFVGFVPLEWLEKYGSDVPLNRREVLLQDIQIDSLEDMRILSTMKSDAGKKVALTFNSPFYNAASYEMIAGILCELQNIGFEDFIIADVGLLAYLQAQGFRANIHISGEAGVFSPDAVRFFEKLGASRIIFPRKISPERMAKCISVVPQLEYEAFILNEKCHYSGAYCSSLHCDHLASMCRVPYSCGEIPAKEAEQDMSAFGAGGCGICALERLENAGVGCLKIVGRGGHIDLIERDVQVLRAVLDGEDYNPDRMKFMLFPAGCAENCYYQT